MDVLISKKEISKESIKAFANMIEKDTWHMGSTPTEEGWYFVKTDDGRYTALKYENGKWIDYQKWEVNNG